MKRFFALLICLVLISSIVATPASAASTTDQIIISQEINYVNDDCYFIETITIPSIQAYGNAKTGTKTAVCVSSGTAIFSISVTGNFTYDGSTASATSASSTISAHVEGVTLNSQRAYTSGASACAFGSVSYKGITLQKTVTLTCDKNGNLS